MMALIILTSASGAPGVTTTALGLALTWPRDVLLVDADRDPSQAVLAGYLHGVDAGGRGLVNLSRQHSGGLLTSEDLLTETLPLTTDQSVERRFLPGFSHPGSAAIFRPMWSPFVDLMSQLGQLNFDVIVDVGRIGRDGLQAEILARARLVLVVVRSTLRSLAAARLYLPYLADQLEQVGGAGQIKILVVGPSRPYSISDIEKQFGVAVAGSVVIHEDARVLSDGDSPPQRFEEGGLLRSFRTLSSNIRASLDTEPNTFAGNLFERGRRILIGES